MFAAAVSAANGLTISLGSFGDASTLLYTWLSILSLLGAGIAWWSKRNRRNIERALHELQGEVATLKRKNLRVLVYARKLYDVMKTQGLTPPDPPDEFFE